MGIDVERRYGPLSEMLSGVRLFSKRPSLCRKDFFEQVLDGMPRGRFCGRWTLDSVAEMFLETGCFAHWHAQGYDKIWIEIEPSEVMNRFELNVWTQVETGSELLMQLVIWLEYTEILSLNEVFPTFHVEHLRLQSPGIAFSREPLPGQDFASSGLLRRVFGLVKNWAAATGAEMIAEIPEYFHTAFIFGEYFSFVDEEMESLFYAMKRDLMTPGMPLVQVSRAFEEGRIRYRGEKWLWPTELQAYALSHELRAQIRKDCVSGAGVFEICRE